MRGRPRSLRAKRAVLNAVRELVEKGGYHAATIEAIAARSGVAKTTIYRWWPNRSALVVDQLVEMVTEAAPPPARAGSLRELRTELRLVARSLDGLPGRLAIALLGETQRDPEIHKAMVRAIFHPRRNARARVIRQAQASGTLRGDVPPLLAVDLLYGPLFYRAFILHEPVGGGFVNQVLRHVLAGLLAAPAARR